MSARSPPESSVRRVIFLPAGDHDEPAAGLEQLDALGKRYRELLELLIDVNP